MGPDPRAQLAPDGLSQCHPGVSLNSMLRVPHKGISVVAFTFFKGISVKIFLTPGMRVRDFIWNC
jgi:hypothetical protein